MTNQKEMNNLKTTKSLEDAFLPLGPWTNLFFALTQNLLMDSDNVSTSSNSSLNSLYSPISTIMDSQISALTSPISAWKPNFEPYNLLSTTFMNSLYSITSPNNSLLTPTSLPSSPLYTDPTFTIAIPYAPLQQFTSSNFSPLDAATLEAVSQSLRLDKLQHNLSIPQSISFGNTGVGDNNNKLNDYLSFESDHEEEQTRAQERKGDDDHNGTLRYTSYSRSPTQKEYLPCNLLPPKSEISLTINDDHSNSIFAARYRLNLENQMSNYHLINTNMKQPIQDKEQEDKDEEKNIKSDEDKDDHFVSSIKRKENDINEDDEDHLNTTKRQGPRPKKHKKHKKGSPPTVSSQKYREEGKPRLGRPKIDQKADTLTIQSVDLSKPEEYMVKDRDALARLSECYQKVNKDQGYSCFTCCKTFKTKSALKDHFITHLELRPFVCKFCNSGFKRRQALQRHIRGHHSTDKPFPCSSCHKSFSRNDSLKKHMECKHSSN